MSRARILIIEDDPDILELLEYNLTKQNYRVYTATNGETGLSSVRSIQPDLIILDIMLPGIDGLEVCKAIRTDKDLPYIALIMLTAKSQESDVIVGLELGADDYMSKPFSPNELAARIKAVLRRNGPNGEALEPAIRLGPLTIDPNKYEVLYEGQPLLLTLSEFRLLSAMAKRPGKVFSREQLLSQLSDQDTYLIDRNIDVHVRAIRKKLKGSSDLIQTVRGIGYKCQEAHP